MTETDWLTTDDPKSLLEVLVGQRQSDRKLRLFAVACSRRTLCPDPQDEADSRAVADVAERFADGAATAEDRARAHPHRSAKDTWWSVAPPEVAEAAWLFADPSAAQSRLDKADLLRDLFGNPF